MNLEIHFRSIESTDAIRNHIEDKASKLAKYLAEEEHVRVVVGIKGKSKVHFAEVYWHDSQNRKDYFARKEGDYLYTQIDEIFETMIQQVSKQHAKAITKKRHKKLPLKKAVTAKKAASKS